jgi:hypothetical protein
MHHRQLSQVIELEAWYPVLANIAAGSTFTCADLYAPTLEALGQSEK